MNKFSPLVVGLLGASGRAGGALLSLLSASPDYQLGAAIVSAQSRLLNQRCLGQELNKGLEVLYTSDIKLACASCQAWLDFSLPESSLALARICAEFGRPLLIGTTGQNEAQLEELRAISKSAPILVAPNTSLGVFALHEVSALARKILGPDYEVEILEFHHKLKKDAPSGTALSLGRTIAAASSETNPTSFIVGRGSGSPKRGENEIGFASLRAGDVVGEHTVYFTGSGERIELHHSATDRAVFARGALKLLSKLANAKPGFYRVKDLFGGTVSPGASV